ncbi:unnamed protein product [Linum tenue]|uniref:TIR domain-containing protein n=1 Tax=Linum tenue TaxID=586396 RepID=A0AAV0PDI8_9ROSI|nr:unnamed protein product [Linum tenue]
MEPIASSSSSSSSSTCSTLPSLLPAREYEVFLSFRGFDVRNTFSDHLYASLSRSKIRAFRDEEELPKGEEISPSLIRAIGESKIYIPIFSENYASSKWCLQELAQMVECCKREKGHLFLPIFYLVDPRDVRHQQGPYEQAFEQHAQKHSSHTVQGWKEALQVVGKMKGWHVTESNGQGVVINEVLSKIELHLRRIYRLVTDELVGIDTHVEEVVKLLNLGSNNPKVIGIHGMGGIGKTTLSKAVYNKISAQFDRCCFLEGVKETLTRNDGVISLQNKIISSILRQDYQVENMSEGINVIKERVCKHKLILVLDDVDDKFEFDQILGKLRDFSLESRFIFTTRNKKLDEDNRFWMHDHIRDLGRAIVQEEDIRHPHRRSRIWSEKDAMDLLRNNEVNNRAEVLMVDMLRWKNEVLTENEFKKLHWLRYLEVRKRSLTGDFSKILPNLCMLRLYVCDSTPANLNMKKLVVLDLESCGVEDNWRGWKEMQLAQKLAVINLRDCQELTRAPDLSQCVSLESINIEGCSAMKGALHIGNFKNLKTLKLVGTQITELTGDIRMLQKLEEIDARHTDLRGLPAGIDSLTSLKTLNLASEDEVTPHSMKVGRLPTSLKRLSISSRGEIPNLLELKELESLSFSRCYHLQIPEDIGELVNLKELIVWRSPLDALFPLKALPSSLTTLAVVDCGKLWRLPSLANLNKLTALNLKQLGAWEIRGLGELRALKTMEITDAPNLNKLDGLETLFHLTHLKLEGCGSLAKLPSLANLIKLQRLEIINCGQLKDKVTGLERLVSLEHSLRLLDMSGCSSITKLGDLSGLKNLVELHMKKCTKLTRVTGIDRLETLRALKMSGCRSIKQLGDLSGLENLHTLDISGCIELTEVKGIERLPSLEYLWMSDCRSIKELGNLSGLRKLRQFHIRGCTELTEVKGLERLQSLEYLWMSDCRSIKELGDLSRMKKLREFDIRGCTQLAQVKGLEELKWLWDPRMDKRLKVKYLWERYGERQVNRVVRFAHEKHLRRRHSRNGAQPLSPGKT